MKAEEFGPVLTSGYERLKGSLLRCIDEMLDIETVRGFPCDELREKIGPSSEGNLNGREAVKYV